MINKYPGTCTTCNERVEVGAGEAYRANDGRWAVRHAGCAAQEPAREPEGAGAVSLRAGAVRAPAATTSDVYTLLSGHTASPYQAAIFEHAKYGRGSVIVKARAGVGKTTTMKNMVVYLPPRAHVQLFAFGTEAAAQLDDAIKELATRYPERSFRDVRAGTFHSVGMAAVLRHLNLPKNQIVVDPMVGISPPSCSSPFMWAEMTGVCPPVESTPAALTMPRIPVLTMVGFCPPELLMPTPVPMDKMPVFVITRSVVVPVTLIPTPEVMVRTPVFVTTGFAPVPVTEMPAPAVTATTRT